MLKTIPLHSLIIAVGANDEIRRQTIASAFADYEIVSASDITYSLVGDANRRDINAHVFSEVRARVALKLRLGERVVVDAANLRRNDRLALARLGSDVGAPVFYLVCDPSGADEASVASFEASQREIMRGDGVAEVVDWRVHTPSPVSKAKPSLDDLRRRFSGITLVGDIHGMEQAFLGALSWARSRGHYVVFLGDLIDYGPNSIEVVEEVYKIVSRGDGELILGNHERKIARWIEDESRRAFLSDGNKVTTQAITAMAANVRRRWEGRFQFLVSHASHIRDFGPIVCAHAAVHPRYWTERKLSKDVVSYALFGEFQQTDGRPHLTYGWIDDIPVDTTVFVGHDIRSRYGPLTVTSPNGSRVIFLDTGSGKGGFLTSADIRFVDDEIKIENFNVY